MDGTNYEEELLDSVISNAIVNAATSKSDSNFGIREEIHSITGNEETITYREYNPVFSLLKMEDEYALENKRAEEEHARLIMQNQYEFNLRMAQMQNQYQLQQQLLGMMGYIEELQTKMIGLTNAVQKQQLLLDNPTQTVPKSQSAIFHNDSVFNSESQEIANAEYEVFDDETAKNDTENSDKNQVKTGVIHNFVEIVDEDLM